jgi:S-formylglutathione hydrolase
LAFAQGGHGALTLYLLYPELYKSSSAFAPITHPTKAAWGKKAFQDGPDGKGGYLKGGLEEGKGRDATELIKKVGGEGRKVKILVDQVRHEIIHHPRPRA